jgi:hypothetical protein
MTRQQNKPLAVNLSTFGDFAGFRLIASLTQPFQV